MWKHRVFQFVFGLIVAVALGGGVNIVADNMVYSQTPTLAVSGLGGGC